MLNGWVPRSKGCKRMEANKRIAVVTGGNKGIGLEICKELAANGLGVILTARDEKRGNEAVDKLTADYGFTNIIFHQLDVTDHSSIASLADFVKKQFGKLDILVNNAAITGVELSQPIDEKLPQPERAELFHKYIVQIFVQSYEKAVDCLKTNYYGVKYMMEAFLPLLLLSNAGRIVNVSSSQGQLQGLTNNKLRKELEDIDNLTVERIDHLTNSFPKHVRDNTLEEGGWPPRFSAYRASKVLMNAYTRIIAKRYPSVTINCVNPGYVGTDLNYNTGALTVSEGARGPVMVALAEGGPTGQFYDQTQLSIF
ncbi:NAD(P)-binding Rossmann-fold superfamily protein [Rhynchospora pubera]|uniref:Short-chain dehydrogenase/reductase n=1 Tax=Rhynchospora pubera TaxID=906938 RepID=A0AAV8C2S8_9POAL|nr:NAD(P)-binding Rossmann-fold superfamily protein [Rhynchospora pubera]